MSIRIKRLKIAAKIPLIILGVFLINCRLFGQSCAEVLNSSTTSYNEGGLGGVFTTDFDNCLRGRQGLLFADADMVSAKRLVTLVNIYQDKKPEAEEAMVELLLEGMEF